MFSLLMTAVPVGSTITEIDGVSNPIFLLVRVAPSTPIEFVTIQNASNQTADPNGWSIDDGEGWIKVNTTILLHPGERLSFSSDTIAFNSYYPDELVMAYRGGNVTRHGAFALADKGDQVTLVGPGGEIADAFCYGTATPSSGWTGMPFTPMPKGDMAVRDPTIQDTGMSTDWFRSCAGRSERTSTTYRASVDPFTSPEDAQNRMIREIGYARNSIDACVYELGDPVVTKIFVEAEASGVDVRLLIEGQPVAGLTNSSKTAVAALVDAGCDVRLMVSNQSYRRYDCLHAKYFVVDKERVTVMSENWAGGLVSNRGWGVTVVSQELADDVINMFQEDSSLERRDVKDASSAVKDWYTPSQEVEIPKITGAAMAPVIADVSVIASPDTSYQSIVDLVSSATTRLMVEQLYIDPAWVEGNQIMDELVDAASRGVKVRVLLDQTFVDTSNIRNNSMTVDALNALANKRDLDLEARLVSDYHDLGVLHNKGVIADDKVLVSSINWVDASIFQNREVGLVISSSSVSSYFADYFWQDWAVDPDPPTITIPWNKLTLIEGQPVVLDATKSRDNAGISSFLWTDELTGNEWNGSYVLAFLESGIHNITLKVTDGFGNIATERILVVVDPPTVNDEPNYLLIVPVGAGGLAYCFWLVWKKIKGR
jgi:phosphatidylserine/phosphatidylglycerophosphate/cardiolipin synthase-like enzyme